jgi:hypothetical protein
MTPEERAALAAAARAWAASWNYKLGSESSLIAQELRSANVALREALAALERPAPRERELDPVVNAGESLVARVQRRLHRMEHPDIGPDPGCDWRSHYYEDTTRLLDALERAEAQLARLREAVRKHGTHYQPVLMAGCAVFFADTARETGWRDGDEKSCNCWLGAALAAAARGTERAPQEGSEG